MKIKLNFFWKLEVVTEYILRNNFFSKTTIYIYSLLFIFIILTNNSFSQKLLEPENYLFKYLSIGYNKTTVRVSDIYQDKSGFIWIATQVGLYRYDGNDWISFYNKHDDSTSLSDSQVRDIFEDSKGRMWIGTVRGGLCQYLPEKQKFTRYPYYQKGFDRELKTNELSRDEVYEIIEDLKGGLWIGTFKGGLNRMIIPDEPDEPAKFIHYTNTPYDPSNKNPHIVYSLFRDSKGQAWMGTRFRGVAKLIEDPETGDLINIQYMGDLYDDPNYFIHSSVAEIFEDSYGDLWYGTYNPAGVLCRIQNPHGKGSEPKLTVFQHSEKDENTIHRGVVFSMAEDPEGNLWMSSPLGGVSFFNRQSGQISRLYSDSEKHRGLSFSSVASLFLDKQKNIWVGTSEGIDVLFHQTKKIKTYQHNKYNPNSIIKGKITGILEDDNGKIWLNGKGNGLCLYDPVKDQFSYDIPKCLKSIPEYYKNMRPIYQDKNKNIWFTNNDILYKYNTQNETVKIYSSMNIHSPGSSTIIRNMYTDNQGRLWGGGKGLWLYDDTTDSFIRCFGDESGPNSLTNMWITGMTEDQEGQLWIGTMNGLSMIDKSRESVTHYLSNKDEPGSLSGNFIVTVYIDRQNRLWVGTSSNGLNRYFKKTNTFKHYDKTDGLASNQISFIIEDKRNNLWLGSENGLTWFNPMSEKTQVYTDEDGLLDRSLAESIYQNEDGRIYITSLHGLNTFYPDELAPDRSKVPVVLTNFLLENQTVPIDENGLLKKEINSCDQITLNYNNNVFAFDFAALNYFKPNSNQFAYKLEGFEDRWTYTTFKNRRAGYTNIPPGDYRFIVKVKNETGNWNNDYKSINVIILPPWWQTWWARSLAALFILTSVVSIYLWRINLLKKRQRELEIQVDERTAELKEANDQLIEMDQFKEGLTGMIVHDLKNPLNSILSSPDSVDNNTNAARQMMNMVMNILDVQKFEETKIVLNLKVKSILKVSMDAIQQIAFLSRRKNIVVENKIPSDFASKIDSDLIERVFVNLLTNAIKFSPTNGRIILSGTKLDESFLKISVEDNGPGIPEDKIDSIFDKFAQVQVKKSGKVRSTGLGLAFCKLAIEAHRGELSVVSDNSGTIFSFVLRNAGNELLNNSSDKNIDSIICNEELTFSEEEKLQIKLIVKGLKELEHYELTKIEILLNKLVIKENNNLARWKKELQTAIFTSNKERYIYLLKIAE